jgi:hypothetical protein
VFLSLGISVRDDVLYTCWIVAFLKNLRTSGSGSRTAVHVLVERPVSVTVASRYFHQIHNWHVLRWRLAIHPCNSTLAEHYACGGRKEDKEKNNRDHVRHSHLVSPPGSYGGERQESMEGVVRIQMKGPPSITRGRNGKAVDPLIHYDGNNLSVCAARATHLGAACISTSGSPRRGPTNSLGHAPRPEHAKSDSN